MGKLVKWLLGLVLLLVVLVVAAVIVLPMVIDPNDYKAEIVAAIEKKTGRDFAIAKDLTLTTFPWLGVETGGVLLGNAKGFGTKPFAQVEHLAVRVKVAPLFSRQLEVDTLVLDGLQLNLAKNAQGKANWADLQAAAKPQGQATPSHKDAKPDDGQLALLGFMVQGVEIKNTQIHWQDAQTGQDYKLQDVHVLAGNMSPGSTTPLEAGFHLQSQQPALDLQMKLNTQVASSTDLMDYQLKDLKVNTQAKGEGLPAEGITLDLSAQATLDLTKDTLAVQELRLNGSQISMQGNLDVSQLRKQPQVQGKLQLAETNLKQLTRLFGTELVTQNAQALTKASANVRLAHDGKVLKLDPLKLQLDASNMQGYVHVLDPKGPVLRGKLDIDQLNLDDYMPPKAQSDKSPAPSGQQPATTKKTVPGNPLAALVPLDVQIETRIGGLVANKAKMQDVQVKVTSKKGVLKVAPFKAKLYDGNFDGNITVDARGKTPKVHTIKHLTNIQIGPLLKDVAGQDRLSGRGEVHTDMRVVGISETEIRRSLSGTANFRFLDGAFKGVNIAKVVRDAKNALAGKTQQVADDTANQTDFAEISGSILAKKGVISNQDLQAKSPLLRIEGKGTVDLPQDNIDYLLVTELVGSLEGQGGKGRDELSGLPIPIKVKGALTDPSYSPDLKALLDAKAKQKLEQEKEKLRQKAEKKIEEEIKDKVGEKAGELLKGLFGR